MVGWRCCSYARVRVNTTPASSGGSRWWWRRRRGRENSEESLFQAEQYQFAGHRLTFPVPKEDTRAGDLNMTQEKANSLLSSR